MSHAIRHLLEVPWIGGIRSFRLTIAQADRYRIEPGFIFKLVVGVTEDEHAGWLESYGRIRCIASTTDGHQCRGQVPRCQFADDPAGWVEAQRIGGYCAAHDPH